MQAYVCHCICSRKVVLGLQVVLPMLDSAVVAPGWISSLDFYTGLAIIQAFPGPLFNLSAYLGKQRHTATIQWLQAGDHMSFPWLAQAVKFALKKLALG